MFKREVRILLTLKSRVKNLELILITVLRGHRGIEHVRLVLNDEGKLEEFIERFDGLKLVVPCFQNGEACYPTNSRVSALVKHYIGFLKLLMTELDSLIKRFS